MAGEIEARVVEWTARGIADAASRAIAEGAYAEGEKLPTIRQLAKSLGVATNTVASAWTMLARAGIVHSDRRRGTTVSCHPRFGPERTRRTLVNAIRFGLDLSTGLPDADLLPDLRRTLGRLESSLLPRTYLDEPVIPELLELIGEDWPFPAEVLTIVDGVFDALDLVVSTKLRFGDRVAVERVTDPNILDLLEVAGVRLVPLDLDEQGVAPDSLERAIADGARWAFLQPRAQQPTGATWSTKRADNLAAVLKRHRDVAVLEIDLTGPVATGALPSLGTRVQSRVLHVRTYSASHGPELRIAALGGAGELMDDLVERRYLGQGWTSRILQGILLDFLHDRDTRARVDEAREEYSRRRARFVAELAERDLASDGDEGLLVRVPVPNEATALIALASRDIGVAPGTPGTVDPRDSSHIIVTSARLPQHRAAEVAEAIHQTVRTRRVRRVR
ncbi:aminotransferase-like domain-containing protein [Phytohabitans kaempferiae]|uniref:PLP-dependent aminotransferase family protein n=1 Tax=Phytohabitans kaempferiae TaxID=1620943 RepID=A0ABV6M790_9ACTN